MKILVTLVALAFTCGLGCHLFKAEEPKQRQDWIASPMRYGDTQFDGLHSPGPADAGVE